MTSLKVVLGVIGGLVWLLLVFVVMMSLTVTGAFSSDLVATIVFFVLLGLPLAFGWLLFGGAPAPAPTDPRSETGDGSEPVAGPTVTERIAEYGALTSHTPPEPAEADHGD